MGDQLKVIVMIQQHDYDISDQDGGSRDGERWTDSRNILKGGSIELTDGIYGNKKKELCVTLRFLACANKEG